MNHQEVIIKKKEDYRKQKECGERGKSIYKQNKKIALGFCD